MPVPFLVLLLVTGTPRWPAPGLVLIALGEGLRLAAVGHIGLPSRTRAPTVGALVTTGPYARLRNPLYLGNILILLGFGVWCWPWAGFLAPLLAGYYGAIVAWEERNLADRLGDSYLEYQRRVPRWLPLGPPRPGSWSARRAFRSERTTLGILALGLALLGFRTWFL